MSIAVGAALAILTVLLPTLALARPDDGSSTLRPGGVAVPFIPNTGHVDSRVAFYASSSDGTVFVTRRGELVYSLAPARRGPQSGRSSIAARGWALRETFRGGRVRPVGQAPSVTRVSYFVGDDPKGWRPDVGTFEQVGLGQVWPGVDVSLRARGHDVEKVFTVRPGAVPSRIRMRVDGASSLAVDADGALVAPTGLGPVTLTKPTAYQERDGARQSVDVAYRVVGREYGFTVGAHDPALPLVIDPLLQTTYLGGSGADYLLAITISPTTGDVYLVGATRSTNFPGTAGQLPFGGGLDDAFVARLNSSLTTLIRATYFGGSGDDNGNAIVLHPTTGDVYIAGETDSTNLPTTGGGAQASLHSVNGDAFVARLNGALTTVFQTSYLGGNQVDTAAGLAIHPTTGDVYVVGLTGSTDFPKTLGGPQPSFGGVFDGFVARLNGTLTSLIQSTYLGGSGSDGVGRVAIHPTNGDVYVAGSTGSANFPSTGAGAQPTFGGGDNDAFVARLPPSLASLVATYIGGSDSDGAGALAIHPTAGDVYVAGSARSTNLPGTAGGAQPASGGGTDGFVARLPASLGSFTQVTYLGGSGEDIINAIAIQPATGQVYVAGNTNLANFPGIAGGALTLYSGAGDGFAARLNAGLTSLLQSTYIGGSNLDEGRAIAVHPSTGDVYVAGLTASTNLPTTGGGAQPNPGGDFDAFVTRLTWSLARTDPTLTMTAAVSQTTFAVGDILVLGGSVVDPGLPYVADFYVGIVRPDGSIQFFTSSGIVLGAVSDLKTFKPAATALPLGTPFSVSTLNFYTHPWTVSDQRGGYVFFIAAVKTGALADGSATSDEILGLATAPFALQ